jgi:biopolymer transport protein ExbD
MITRPLDLASRLSPEPRSFDFLFFVNVGLLALFFALFGSRFVLAPGLGVAFRLPQAAGARAGAVGTTCYISVLRSGQILTDNGLLSSLALPDWLKARTERDRQPVLLIRSSEGVPMEDIARICSLAVAAGFVQTQIAAEEAAPQPPDERRRDGD